jgi:hypothetical protein
MKKLFKISLIAIMLLSIGSTLSAQTTRFTNRNFDERIAQRIVTTDSTLTYVDSLVLGTNETGIVQLTVIGYAKDTAYAVTGVIQARFNKRRGTLTLGTITEIEPITRDAVLANTAVGGATFTLVSVNNNIYVRVKGKATYSITWTTFVKQKSIRTSS